MIGPFVIGPFVIGARVLIRTSVAAVALSFAVTACAGGTNEVAPPDDLSLAGQAGWQAAASNGCMSCHGRDGVGGTGPGWVGLAGSTRQLVDGTQLVADRDYLVRALVDPHAERVDGYSILMPTVDLTDEEIDSIIDYLEEIA